MNTHDLHTLLSAPATAPLQLVGLRHGVWGRRLQFVGETLVNDVPVPFVLRFDDCREQRWQFYSHITADPDVPFPRCTLVDWRWGRSQHRSPAHLLTDYFGLSLFYGTLHLVHADVETALA